MDPPHCMSADTHVRAETAADAAAIAAVVERAFAGAEHASGTKATIVAALRDAGALTLSLVAERDGRIVGHVACSPVTIGDGTPRWYGLGPVAVEPALQGRGIGSTLVRAALDRLRALGAAGCVVLGEPAYYARFGFRATSGLAYPGPPPEYFTALAFDGHAPRGTVAYHAAFCVD